MFEAPRSKQMITVSKGKTVFADAFLKVSQRVFLVA